MARNLTDVYFEGIKNFVSRLNDESGIVHGNAFFDLHDRDAHVAVRAIERHIDLVELLRSARRIVLNDLCMLIYEIHKGTRSFVVKTKFGHLVFRVTYIEARNGFKLNLCTITPASYRHDRDYVLEDNV